MKDRVPGVGASIGLDRLLAGLAELGKSSSRASFTDACVFCQKEADMALYQKVAALLRDKGIACEVFPDAKKMPQQYAWAEKKSIKWGVFADGSLGADSFTLKNLETRESHENATIADAVKKIRG
jgi:histidyl-tRNA synthetase